jgi:hypothetical protein
MHEEFRDPLTSWFGCRLGGGVCVGVASHRGGVCKIALQGQLETRPKEGQCKGCLNGGEGVGVCAGVNTVGDGGGDCFDGREGSDTRIMHGGR